MPEQPPAKHRTRSGCKPASTPGGPAYAELHCYTNYSFLRGASHPDELVQQAAGLGYRALAITDRHSLAGVVRAHLAARELGGFPLLIGVEVTPVDAEPAVLLATDRAAYGRLARLLTVGKQRAPKGECRLTFDDIAAHAEGVIACVFCDWDVGQVGNLPWGRLETCHETEADTSLARGSDAERRERHSHAERGNEGVQRHSHAERGNEEDASSPPPRVASSPHLSPSPPPRVSASPHREYREVFGDRCYALAELHRGPDDRALLEKMKRVAKQQRLPLVAGNGVRYHEPARRFLHDALTAVREGCTVADLGGLILPNAERYLKPRADLAELFAACPEALARTVEIAERCHFSLDELRYEYPHELCPPGMTSLEHLTRLTWQGAHERYPKGIPAKVRRLIEHELKLIEELHYEAYFLTVWDLVRFARGRDILCQGRGSAANSAVCFCLGVTSVDPGRIDVLFERFVSKERNEAPDIDVDFEHERREEVIQYLYEKYGRERAGMTAEVITYRPRSAIRDLGKALGLSLDRVDALAGAMEHVAEDENILAARFREGGLNPRSRLGRQLFFLLKQVLGFPRHLSQHVGGMVITEGPLCELVPIENAAMPGRTVIEWDKNDLDVLGILKVDCLALGMLTAIRKCFALIEQHHGRALTLANVPAEDPEVYAMVQRADTVGVFQIESRAQMSMLPRLKPACFYDLVIEVAIVRPGPIQGDMVHPYLRRRKGDEPVVYPDERVRAVLEKTLGVPIFQEQAMRLAVVAAGFTPGEADQLRRAMGAWRRRDQIDRFRLKMLEGMRANGYDGKFAEQVFNQIRGFGEYGFPESHAASFALLVYVSAWLKHYYPAAFTAALLNSQPMGFYAPAQLVADARKHDVEVLPVDINACGWDCSLEATRRHGDAETRGEGRDAERRERHSHAERGNEDLPFSLSPCPRVSASGLLRLGFRLVRGLSEANADKLAYCRTQTPFTSFDDLVRRTGFTSAVLQQLARADAFGSLGLSRRAALWLALGQQERLPLFAHLEEEDDEAPAELPAMSAPQTVAADYHSVGLTLREHPVQFLRETLERFGAVPAKKLAELANGIRVKAAGLVIMRQRPSTAKGITFVTLEDETGQANLIVRQDVWERYRRAARHATALMVRGILQRDGVIIHVLVDRLDDVSALLAGILTQSRDFR